MFHIKYKSFILALLTCVTHEDCIQALSKSFRIFNHTNEQTHDQEIRSGVDTALCRLLSFLLFKETLGGDGGGQADTSSSAAARSRSQVGEPEAEGQAPSPQTSRATRLSDEITCACQITEMICRCSKQALEASFQKLGPDFLHILACILAHQLPKYQTSSGSDEDPTHQSTCTSEAASSADMKSTNVCLRSVTKILCHYARVQSATTSMARNPKLLSLMIALLQHPQVIPFEACHNTLWVLANMACCNENMQHMASNTRLLDTVIQVANMRQTGTTNIETARLNSQHALRLQHSAFRCLLNLSWEQENKILMSDRQDLVDTIVRIVETKTLPAEGGGGDAQQKAFVTMLLQARLFALGTLRNIAHTPPIQKLRLCTTQDGMLLNLLCDTASSDEDSAVRGKTFAVVFNLVSPETSDILISHPRLIDLLVEAASIPDHLPGTSSTPESANTMAFRSLHALNQAVASSISEENRTKMRMAIDRVTAAKQLQILKLKEYGTR